MDTEIAALLDRTRVIAKFKFNLKCVDGNLDLETS